MCQSLPCHKNSSGHSATSNSGRGSGLIASVHHQPGIWPGRDRARPWRSKATFCARFPDPMAAPNLYSPMSPSPPERILLPCSQRLISSALNMFKKSSTNWRLVHRAPSAVARRSVVRRCRQASLLGLLLLGDRSKSARLVARSDELLRAIAVMQALARW